MQKKKDTKRRLRKAWSITSQLTTYALSIVLLFSMTSLSAFAQTETGQITVKATDPSGAVIAGATVTVKSLDRGTEVTATTNEEGVATFTNLQPGLYEVTVAGAGFAAFTQRAQVTVGGKLSVDAGLSAQARGETVNIVAGESGVEVNTQTQELSDVVSQKQITELPTLTRNPYALVQLSGNVNDVDDTLRGTGFNINGQRSASTNILLDGGENVSTFDAGVGQSVPLDAVQEFRIITSNFSAEYGRASGGIVNVGTKAGTNSFHGTLYEFNRVSALASNTFDNNARGVEKGVFTRNQFGYSVGGPIKKDKLFFFSSTEWLRIRSTGEVISIVPTPELIAASSANTKAFFGAYNLVTPINGAVFSVSRVITDLGLSGAAAVPFTSLPGGLPAFGEVRSQRATNLGGGIPQNDWQSVNRIDWNVSDKSQFYFRAANERGKTIEGSQSFSPYEGFNTGVITHNQNYLGSLTHTFSPSVVSQSKLVFNRLIGDQPLGDQPPGPTLFINANGSIRLGGSLIRFPGYLPTSPGSAIPFAGPQNFIQAYEDLNWTRGTHQWRFGGAYIHIRDNRTFGAYQNSVAVLGATNSQALGNLVLGQLRQFSAAIDPQGKFPCFNDPVTGAVIQTPECTITLPVASPSFSRSNRYHEFAVYANDSWRVKPTLTLNLGVRYEYYGVQHNADRNLDSNFYLGDGANIFERIRNGRILRAEESPVGGLWKPDWNNFAPRLGFAWDIFGDGRTSLRGGYGVAYERNFGNVTFNVIQNPPNYATTQITAPTDVASIPLTTSNAGPLAGSGVTKALPRVSLRAVDPDIVNAYAHFWSASFERQVMANTVASIEYSGSAGRKLYSIANINRPGTGNVYLGDTLTTGGIASGRLNNAGASDINFRGNGGRSNYNALIAGVDSSSLRNLGLRLTARYTYSVTKDNLSSTFSESNQGQFFLGFLDPFDPDLDYGNAEFDVRHRFVSSFTWDVPAVRNASGWLNQVANGWQLTGIINARTGFAFSVFDCTNSTFVPSPCIRAIENGALNFKGHVSHDSVPAFENTYKYIDLSDLAVGTFINPLSGNNDFGPFPANMTKRGAFRAPGFWNVDAAVHKNFKFTERTSLQLRFEAFNVFNHSNLYINGGFENEISTNSLEPGVRGGYVPANFGGQTLATADRRNVQIAAKIIF